MQNEYEKLFDDFLDITEFTLIKRSDGWSLKDNQGANLGDIETDRFTSVSSIIERMHLYIHDYFIVPICDFYDENYSIFDAKEIVDRYKNKGQEVDYDIDILDAIINHSEEISLENCTHEILTE